MKSLFLYLPVLFLFLFSFAGNSQNLHSPVTDPDTSRFCGLSLVAPPQSLDASWTSAVKNVNANWVALMPYGYSYNGKPQVYYNSPRQWWGETVEGCRTLIRHARKSGLKVMVKPMIYVPGSWVGYYDLQTNAEWESWEKSYHKFILAFAQLAEEEGADLFVIGTEFRIAVEKRAAFWEQLIKDTRAVYSGKLTFAANWDCYTQVPFWHQLDFIGINAYFPLMDAQIPAVDSLVDAWNAPLTQMEDFSKAQGKNILITELGYRSMPRPAWRQWEQESVSSNSSPLPPAQANAWEGFFKAAWSRPFVSGCFLWNWYPDHTHSGGAQDSDYTPQNKPAEDVIRKWFGQ